MCRLASFEALVTESERVHKPTSYIRDLYYHDRNYLEEYKPSMFGWYLYDYGTVLIDPHHRDAAVMVHAAVHLDKEGQLYWYDGTALVMVSAEELIDNIRAYRGMNHV